MKKMKRKCLQKWSNNETTMRWRREAIQWYDVDIGETEEKMLK